MNRDARAVRKGGARESALALAIVLLAGLLFALPILVHGKLPSGSDSLFHAMLADGLIDGLRDGHIYPRWVSEMNRGYGAPVFIHYSPLGSYAVALVSIFVPNTIAAMQVVIALSAALSGLTFYSCAREFARPRLAALGSLLYVLLPYHVVGLYDRFGFAEFNAYVWLPLLVKNLRDLGHGFSYRAWAGLAFAYAGLILTHIAVAYTALFLIVPYALSMALRERSWRVLALAGSAGLVALLLSGAYLWPLWAERGLAHTEYIQQVRWGQWSRNFVFGDVRVAAARYANQGLLYTLAIAAVAMLFLKRKLDDEGWDLAFACGLAIFLQLAPSSFVWANVPGMAMVQFPWRFQAFQGLFAALLAVWSLAHNPRTLSRVAVALVSLAAIGFSSTLTGRRPYTLDQAAFERGRVAERVYIWHIPSHVPRWRQFANPTYPVSQERTRLDGEGRIEIDEWSSQRRRLRVEAPEKRELTLRTFAYPGWEVRVDGRPVPIRPDERYGAIAVDVPPGSHRIDVRFRTTGDRMAGACISVVGLFGLGLVGIAARRRPRA